MVTKSRLKMALVAEKGVDFKKLNQKKLAKRARKGVTNKNQVDEWEDVEGSDDGEDEGVIFEEDDSQDDLPAQIDIAGIDDSDSDSSSGVENNDDAQNADEADGDDDEEEEEEEDIPVSDLEDLDDEEKEDIIPHQRLTINNTVALTASLKRIALNFSTLPFSEHQSLTTTESVSIPDVSDDLNRELAFYAQSLAAVKQARGLLKTEGAPFSRPKDYFAEMVKADEHMAKIKGKLIEEAASKKASAEARKQRDLKKFGKQVQVAKLQERDKERRQTMEKIKVLKRKRQDGSAPATATEEADLFDVALDDTVSKADSRRDHRRDKGGANKRQKKDEKFGFGGKKRFSKSGDAMSSGDLSGFSTRKMKGRTGGPGRGAGGSAGAGRGGGGAGGAAARRPGKARRAAGARR